MEHINVDDILEKHGGLDYYIVAFAYPPSTVKDAIKEIIEAVIDRCAKEAITSCIPIDNGSDEGGEAIGVNKDSILDVKQQINYGV